MSELLSQLKRPFEPKHLSWVEKYGLFYPYGKCQCGCGNDAPRARGTNTKLGYIKGEPLRYCYNHHGRSVLTVREKFFSMLPAGKIDDCWEWPQTLGNSNYGFFGHNNKRYLTHRLSYEYHVGPIPDGLLVCHKCDNPPCCNPKHLFVGTDLDNMTDKMEKGRGGTGENNPAAKITEAQVREIRRLWATGWTSTRLAEAFGISTSNAHLVAMGKTWSHVK